MQYITIWFASERQPENTLESKLIELMAESRFIQSVVPTKYDPTGNCIRAVIVSTLINKIK